MNNFDSWKSNLLTSLCEIGFTENDAITIINHNDVMLKNDFKFGNSVNTTVKKLINSISAI